MSSNYDVEGSGHIALLEDHLTLGELDKPAQGGKRMYRTETETETEMETETEIETETAEMDHREK